MALTGSTQNKRPGAGVYPGAGVAAGGQQGRSNIMHNGVGAKSGGRTPAASQPRGQASTGTFGVPARGAVVPGQTLPSGIGSVRPGTAAPIPVGARPRPKPGIRPVAVAPTAGSPQGSAPPIPQYNPLLQDSSYFMDLAGAQQGFDSALNPINSELARLRYRGVGGQTLYDSMYADAQRNFNLGVRDTRDQMSKVGLGRSGRMDRSAAELGSNWVTQQRELDDTVGSTAVNRLETQAAQARGSFAAQQAALQMAAAAREQERRTAYNQSLYGMTIMPEE